MRYAYDPPITGEPCLLCANRRTHTWTEKFATLLMGLCSVAEQLRIDLTHVGASNPPDFNESFKVVGLYRGKLDALAWELVQFWYGLPSFQREELEPALKKSTAIWGQAYKNWRAISCILDLRHALHTEELRQQYLLAVSVDKAMYEAGAKRP